MINSFVALSRTRPSNTLQPIHRYGTGPNTYGILTLADGKVVSHEHKEVPRA